MDLAGVNMTTGHESMTTTTTNPPSPSSLIEEDDYYHYHETLFNYNGPPSCYDIADFGNAGPQESNTTMNNNNDNPSPSSLYGQSSNNGYNYYSDEMMLREYSVPVPVPVPDTAGFDFGNIGQEDSNTTMYPLTPSVVFNGLNNNGYYDQVVLDNINDEVLLSDSQFNLEDTAAVPIADYFVCETPPAVPAAVINQFNMTVENHNNGNSENKLLIVGNSSVITTDDSTNNNIACRSNTAFDCCIDKGKQIMGCSSNIIASCTNTASDDDCNIIKGKEIILYDIEGDDNSNDIASCINDIASCSNYQTNKQKSSKKSSYTKKAPEHRLIREANTWSHTEHRLLLVGLKAYGEGSWTAIARKLLHPFSRSNTQVSSHYQKYVKRQERNTSIRRPSIHDVTLEAKDYCDLCLNGYITEEVENLVKTWDTEFWQEVIEERFLRAMADQAIARALVAHTQLSETPLVVAPSLPMAPPDDL